MGQHSVGIDTAFATKSDTPTHNLGVLVQATGSVLLGIKQMPCIVLLSFNPWLGRPAAGTDILLCFVYIDKN